MVRPQRGVVSAVRRRSNVANERPLTEQQRKYFTPYQADILPPMQTNSPGKHRRTSFVSSSFVVPFLIYLFILPLLQFYLSSFFHIKLHHA